MATVYLASDRKHGREVALKVLRPELSAVLGSERFLNEVSITARLDHPHIVTLIDSGETAGRLWYVLPYIRGESLRQRLEREKQLGLDEALTIAKQVAGALDYAHRQGVVHRDIKPENILLHEGEAMLADFGIALAVKEAGGNRLTETGLSLGTPQYMSPEQATGDRTLDARSDVYSLAAVVYEMLAGEPPVSGPTVQAVIAKLLTERPTRLRVVRDTVPEGIDAAVAKALAKVPADRFPSAGEFAEALKASADGRAGGRVGRKRVALWIGVVAVLAVAGGLGWIAFRPARPPASMPAVRRQVTFTGRAEAPALSPDGKRVAYGERTCDPTGKCTTDVVVQDVDATGVSRPEKEFAGVYDLEWSPDGRYLLVHGTRSDGVFGYHLLPAIGGAAPRLVTGYGAQFIAGGDSVISVSELPDHTFQAIALSVRDLQGQDTSRFSPQGRVPATASREISFSPNGRLSAWLVEDPAGNARWVLATRDGRITDSLDARNILRVAGWTPDSRGLVLILRDSLSPGLVSVVAHGVDRTGRLTDDSRVLLAGIQADQLTVSPAGIAYTAGTVETTIAAITRRDAGSDLYQSRSVTNSTGPLQAHLSPAGSPVLLRRLPAAGGPAEWQLSLAPFDGGPETPIALAGEKADYSWSPDGKRLVIIAETKDGKRLIEVAPATGRTRDIGPLPNASRDPNARRVDQGTDRGPRQVGITDYDLYSRGAISWVEETSGDTLRFRERDGRLHSIGVGSRIRMTRVSQFDDAVIGWGWLPPNEDTLAVFQLDGSGAHVRTLFRTVYEGIDGMHWIRPGVVLMAVRETAYTSALYRLDLESSSFTRLMTLPYEGEAYVSFSNDGRRIVTRTQVARRDVWVARVEW